MLPRRVRLIASTVVVLTGILLAFRTDGLSFALALGQIVVGIFLFGEAYRSSARPDREQ